LQAFHLVVAYETKVQTVDVGAAVASDMVVAQTGRAGMVFARDYCLAVVGMVLSS